MNDDFCRALVDRRPAGPPGCLPLAKRNERERQRVRCVNEGYAASAATSPAPWRRKRLSKVETLRAAIRYISTCRSC
ncbi:Achaete-scute-like protein 3 [Camelus dromedarius]|uniref:Achaete-scute-like protein 3 n=1 Tax=Camelus dromedarius TaxID=9838 RepID=A0A5N4CIW6_CAMDR|nr:Achaete-scute-like protein 3 [Camelus dromedarius]